MPSRPQAAPPRWCRFDLADMKAIDRLGGSIFERWGKLDILVANAGVLGVISPIGHIEAKVFEKVMNINVTAHLASDPLGRSAADPLRCRPRRHPVLGRRPFKCRPVLERLFRLQGRRRSAGAHLGRRDAIDAAAHHQRRSGCHAHRHARAGGSGREPGELPHPSEVAKAILPLLGPGVTETGKLFIVRENKLVDYQPPE